MKRIIVFGIGGIGGYIGARLGIGLEKMGGSEAGKPELVFIARGAHLAAMKAKGLRYRNPAGTESVIRPTLVTDNPAEAGHADLIFLCVKGYDLEDACRSLPPLVGPQTVIVPLLNGADIYERVRSVVAGGTVLPAAIYISSNIAEPGLVVQVGGKGNVVLGREPGKGSYNPAPLAALLEKAEIPYEWFEDPFPAIWTKYLFIAAFGLVTARSGLGIGAVAQDEKWSPVLREILNEIFQVAKAKGIALPEDAVKQAVERGKAAGLEIKTSYQRDVESRGKPNEGELFGGTIVRLGKEFRVSTPTSERVYKEIHLRAAGY